MSSRTVDFKSTVSASSTTEAYFITVPQVGVEPTSCSAYKTGAYYRHTLGACGTKFL